MSVQGFFSLCKIPHPAWLQHDHKNLGLPEMNLFRPTNPCHKSEKNALSCDIKGKWSNWLAFIKTLIFPNFFDT